MNYTQLTQEQRYQILALLKTENFNLTIHVRVPFWCVLISAFNLHHFGSLPYP